MTVQVEFEKQLHKAAAIGDIDAVQKLFSDNQTLSINATDVEHGQTALEIACAKGHAAVVEYLVARGADLNHVDKDGFSAIHYACDSEDQHVSLKMVQCLFAKDPESINKQSLNHSGDTCLHLAARNCNSTLIRWLLDVGADTAVQNATGTTAWDKSQEEVWSRAFYSTPPDIQRSLDSYSAFIEKEVTSGNARDTVFDVAMTKIKDLEVYRVQEVHTLDIFVLLKSLPNRNVLQQSCRQIRRELCRSVDGAMVQRMRNPCCDFETHSDQHLASHPHPDLPDVANVKVYSSLKEIPPWEPAPAPISLPGLLEASPTLQSPVVQNGRPGWRTASSNPNYLSIVMPLLSLELTKQAKQAKMRIESQVRKLAQNLRYCRGISQDIEDFYIAPTLDEYSSPELPRDVLDRRNRDQTLMRGTDRPLIVMVNQAWVWQAQDVLIFAPLGTFRAPIPPYTDLLATTYGQIGTFLADELDCDDTDIIIVKYENALVELAERVSKYVEETGVESIGIEKEKGFFHEIHDIREELSMIRRVLSEKEEVWRKFASTAWPEIWADCLNGRTQWANDVLDGAQRDNYRATMRLIMRPREKLLFAQQLVAQINEDAERVERSVTIQLDLKQKHASLKEAHSTAVMSAAVFGFTVITIIFTPLSFILALFALPVDRFLDSQIPSRWDGNGGMYSTHYIGVWAATTEIVSVALTLAATWLALEYGLKYPVTRKMQDLLSRTSDRLITPCKNVWTAVTGKSSASRSKAKSETSAASIFAPERRSSSLRGREEV